MNTTAHKKDFQPLLSDSPQQHQIKSVSTGESNVSPAPGTFNEEQLNRCTRGHAKAQTVVPLLPDHSTGDCPEQGTPSHSPDTGFVSPESPSTGTLNTKRPSHEHEEHVTEGATQEKSPRLCRPKPLRRYEWPLIINGVYQGKGPLPSCRIEDDESATEPRPYAWPLIILHRARSVEDCDQQPGLTGKETNGNIVDGEEKIDGVKTGDECTDEVRTTDSVFR